jgi:hypothetical protein
LLGPLKRRAIAFRPATIDETARTVEMIAATGNPIAREDLAGPIAEVLCIAGEAIDLSRLRSGLPLLDSHRQDGLERVLGTVLSARIEGGMLVVLARISERHEGLWRDIVAGMIRSVSIGYAVQDFEDGVDRATGRRVRTVTRWTLMEVSLVPVAADGGAHVRSQPMPPETIPTTPEAPAPAPTPPAIQTRAAINQEIRALTDTAGLARALADDLIDRGAAVEEARAAINTARLAGAGRTTAAPRVEVIVEHDTAEAFRAAAGEGLYTRINPRHTPSERARHYVNTTMLDLSRECLRRAGITTTGLPPAEIITRSLHSTSDFPALLGDAMHRTLRPAYDAAPAVLKRLARQTTAKDFRARTKLQLSEAETLLKVNEGGEYKYSTFVESGATSKIDTFGRIFGITRQALINDDVGAFIDVPAKMGRAAAEFESKFLVDLLVEAGGLGPMMADGNRLFSTAHGNVAATGGNIDKDTLSAARLAMRRQKDLSGEPINVRPAFLLLPPELETDAEVAIATVQAGRTDDVNPFGGKMEVLVESRLVDTGRWYVAADPTSIEGLEYAYLQGAEGPQTESRTGFEIDGVEWKVRLDFGATFIDWRGWFTNGGA